MDSEIPPAVRRAMNHVRAYHPEVTTVIFNGRGNALYMGDRFEFPVFGRLIDESILERAQEEVRETVGLPAVFSYVPTKR